MLRRRKEGPGTSGAACRSGGASGSGATDDGSDDEKSSNGDDSDFDLDAEIEARKRAKGKVRYASERLLWLLYLLVEEDEAVIQGRSGV